MTQDHKWLSVLADLADNKTPCVLITVLEAKGFTPRDSGTKMVVTKNDQYCTIGGGNLEFQAIEEARKMLEGLSTENTVKDYPLGPALAQCCGGSVSILLEPFLPNDKELLLFGAGHVGKEVIGALENLPISIKWIDERENEFPSDIPSNCAKIITSSPVSELSDISDKSYIVIMTHDHDLDYDLVKASFDKKHFAYLGLIGSDTKRARFEKKLVAEGIKKSDLKNLICPIGIKNIPGKHPREIALSLAAELLQNDLTKVAV
jgi:xanthine dehydrogenase accessory factor